MKVLNKKVIKIKGFFKAIEVQSRTDAEKREIRAAAKRLEETFRQARALKQSEIEAFNALVERKEA